MWAYSSVEKPQAIDLLVKPLLYAGLGAGITVAYFKREWLHDSLGRAFSSLVTTRQYQEHDPTGLPSQTHHGDQWFSEVSEEQWPGQAMSLRVKKVLYDKKSDLQSVKVFDATNWGRVLTLDGCIQCTTRDEHAYQEMMAHIPLHLHSSPKRVLVIGGGDGGVLREVARHSSVEVMHICEIDGDVISVSKKYLPQLGCGFDDPRVTVMLQDGAKYLREVARNPTKKYDVIICDTSDPVGPAEELFSDGFYDSLFNALTPEGIAVAQGECIWLHLPLIKTLVGHAKKAGFKDVGYASISIPTYPCGQIGALTCSRAVKTKVTQPVREVEASVQKQLKYYSTEVHKAAFILPAFAQKAIFE